MDLLRTWVSQIYAIRISTNARNFKFINTSKGPVKPNSKLTEYVFTGGVVIDGHGDYVTDHRGQEYVGKPSPEVDEAWDALLVG
jgi:hypothetical protein